MHTRYNPWNTTWPRNRYFNYYNSNNETAWTPAVELFDNGDGYTLRADLPGVAKDNININVNDGYLVLEGERKKPDTKELNYYKTEVTYGKFKRTFKLASEINADGIKAEFADGVLTINIPKPEEVKPKQIQIN